MLDDLRRKTKIIEGQLTQQKVLTRSLYPEMVATEKAVATDRTMLVKLESCCKRLGNIVKGPEFK